MCIYLYVCIYIYVYIYTYTLIYIYVHISHHITLHYMQTYMYTCIILYIQIHTYSVYMYVHMYMMPWDVAIRSESAASAVWAMRVWSGCPRLAMRVTGALETAPMGSPRIHDNRKSFNPFRIIMENNQFNTFCLFSSL